jgi:hypothetical protein
MKAYDTFPCTAQTNVTPLARHPDKAKLACCIDRLMKGIAARQPVSIEFFVKLLLK